MSESTEAGKWPGWTSFVSPLGCVIVLLFLLANRYFGLSWWISVPAAIVITVGGVFLDRAIERKYARSRRAN